MAENQQGRDEDKGSPERTAYQLLHLLPSAPQDLVVEVYWHLVHQLQAAAREEPTLRLRLDELNKAYASVVDPEARAEYEAYRAGSPERLDGAQPGSRAGLLRRLWKGSSSSPSPRRNPWQLLHLDPGAPPDVAELAYSFWRVRLRGQWGDLARMELEKLQEAYDALGKREPDSPPEPEVAEPDAGANDTEASMPEAAPGAEAAASPSGATDADQETDSAEAGDRSEEKARLGARRAWRSLTDLSASLGRRTRTGAGATWESFSALLKQRAADPFHEYRPGAPIQTDLELGSDLAGPAAEADIEERLAALSESGVAAESATDARADAGEPDGASAQIPARPELLPTAHSEASFESQATQPSRARGHLVAESGFAQDMEAAVGPKPFTIGAGPTCNLVLKTASTNGRDVAARIWTHEDRFMLHVIGTAPAVLVNGQAVVWVVLEDGDRLQIGDSVFRFHLTSPERGSQRVQKETRPDGVTQLQ